MEKLREQRELARRAMRMFEEFRPRLVGALVRGDGPLNASACCYSPKRPEKGGDASGRPPHPVYESEIELHYSGEKGWRSQLFLLSPARPRLNSSSSRQGHTAIHRVIPITGGRNARHCRPRYTAAARDDLISVADRYVVARPGAVELARTPDSVL